MRYSLDQDLLTVAPFGPSYLPQPRVYFRNQPFLPSRAPRSANISAILSTLRILPVATGLPTMVGVYESVWQLCCLGEFLVISMIHLHSSEVVARCGLDFLCAGYFQRGLSRHMRVRFNAVVARANSAATFRSPRMRKRRMPRCSFKIPMTSSASAFRRRYNARPAVEANLLRMRRRAA